MFQPRVTQELLEALEETFPDKLPRENREGRTPSGAELARLIGQQDVMRKLRQMHRVQNP
jgi:hypothetical protein